MEDQGLPVQGDSGRNKQSGDIPGTRCAVLPIHKGTGLVGGCREDELFRQVGKKAPWTCFDAFKIIKEFLEVPSNM